MSPKSTTVLADASSAEVRDGITLQRRSAQLKHHTLMYHFLALVALASSPVYSMVAL